MLGNHELFIDTANRFDMKSFITSWSPASEDDGADGYTLLVFPLRMDDGALTSWGTETGVGVGSLARHSNLPWLVQPGGDGHSLDYTAHIL